MKIHAGDHRRTGTGDMHLHDGARVAVIGGGPSGSFFAFFLIEMAERAGLRVNVDVYEPRDFTAPGPAGCNMCGGIISESLVQALAADGINLPSDVVQRGIESYVLHVPEGSVQIAPRLAEKRIGALHRGGGPRGSQAADWRSFDGYLLSLAQSRGAHVVRDRVNAVAFVDGRPRVGASSKELRSYDLLAVALGANSPALKLFEDLAAGYHPPRTTRAKICEIPIGRDGVTESLGSAMHVFLLDLPGVEFAALIPKGDYVTACLLGDDIDNSTMRAFLASSAVRDCFATDRTLPDAGCHCGPRLNVGGAPRPYGDRIVYIGDCGVTRLYKDGIGAAYRTAKAAAATAVFRGVSESAFGTQFRRVCAGIERDNLIGRAIFACARRAQRHPGLRRALLEIVSKEQRLPASSRTFSDALWDTFTGSAPYREVLSRMLALRAVVQLARSLGSRAPGRAADHHSAARRSPASSAESAGLGRHFRDGEVIVREGEIGDHMFVVQQGTVEVYKEKGGATARLALLEEGAIFGEMALCDPDVRSASVRASGPARVLTVDRAAFLRRVHEDPSLALRVVQNLSRRIRSLNDELVQLKGRRPTAAALGSYAPGATTAQPSRTGRTAS